MNAHRINVLDEAYRDHIVVLIADDFEFQFFPAEDRFLNEDLVDQRSLKSACHDDL